MGRGLSISCGREKESRCRSKSGKPFLLKKGKRSLLATCFRGGEEGLPLNVWIQAMDGSARLGGKGRRRNSPKISKKEKKDLDNCYERRQPCDLLCHGSSACCKEKKKLRDESPTRLGSRRMVKARGGKRKKRKEGEETTLGLPLGEEGKGGGGRAKRSNQKLKRALSEWIASEGGGGSSRARCRKLLKRKERGIHCGAAAFGYAIEMHGARG